MKAVQNKFGFIVFILFMLLLATMLGVLFTQGRYSEEAEHASDIFDGDLEYIVAEQVEVHTADEFIAAVENGYSNIKIADEVDNPLIITEGVTDVGSDLILDLNGHEIQRNNREPMLNIVDGIRMTVIDTKGGGSFYNPVGSVLQIDGGTLTVAAGDFVSGPKKAEYESAVASEHTGGRISKSTSATVYTKSGDGYAAGNPVSVPVINPHISTVNNHPYVNGNMYFTSVWSNNASLIPDDTYLYYVVDDDTVSHAAISSSLGSADFYYSYCIDIDKDDYTNVVDGPADGESVIEVTVYGYYEVKNSAAGESGVTPDYATIKMLGGNMYARGGAYHSYFGVEHTYGIYASGGYMAVESGSAFETIEGGVCVACDYDSQSSSEYLRISDGKFSSDYGDTVRVSGGEMVVTGGSFEKDTTGAPEKIEDGERITSAALSIEGGGRLDMSSDDEIAIKISGSYARGIYANGGEIDISNANIAFSGNNGELNGSTGIYASGGTVKAANLTVDMENNDSVTSGSENYGIYASGGTVRLSKNVTLNVVGAHSVGIYASSPDSAVLSGEPYNIEYKSEDTVNADVSGDTVNADESAHSLTVNVSGALINVSGALNNGTLTSTAISTQGGGVKLNGNATILSDGLGITAQAQDGSGGNIVFGEKNGNSYEYTVETTNGTAIYVNGGSIKFASGIVDVTSTIKGKYDWNGTTAFYDGICVQGGSLDASGAVLNVTHTGIDNNYPGIYPGIDNDYSGDLYALEINSFAVRVTSSQTKADVKISAGTLTNEIGGGLYVGGTNPDTSVSLGSESGKEGNLTIKTNGEDYIEPPGGGYFKNPDSGSTNSNWNYLKNKTGGHAVEIEGGILKVYSGTYAAKFGNGILVSNGTANLYGGTYAGNDPYKYNGDLVAGSGASYGMRMHGGKLNIYGGTFGSAEINGYNYAGSGAFITGTDNTTAEANIYGGTFNATGRIGVSIMRESTVTFGAEPVNAELPSGITVDDLFVNGTKAAIAVEKYRDVGSNSKITIHDGEYKGGYSATDYNDGIWYGDSTSELHIYGGTISVSGKSGKGDRAGLYFDVTPTGTNVQISGGEFYGGKAKTITAEKEWDDSLWVEKDRERSVNGGGIGVAGGDNWYRTVYVDNIIPSGVSIYNGDDDSQINRGSICDHLAGNYVKYLGSDRGKYGLASYTHIKIGSIN